MDNPDYNVKPPQYTAYEEYQMGYGSGMAAGAAWPGNVIGENGRVVVIDLNSKSQPFLMGYGMGFGQGRLNAIAQDHAHERMYWDNRRANEAALKREDTAKMERRQAFIAELNQAQAQKEQEHEH